MAVGSQTGQIVYKNLSGKKPFTKIGRVEWLKEESLSTNPSTAKKKKEGRDGGDKRKGSWLQSDFKGGRVGN
jgi:hypothetical protein